MTSARLSRSLRLVFQAPVILYRWRCGWLLGHRFLLLIHIGRRTGLPRRTVLEVVEYRRDGPEAIVISAFGRNADWLLNIQAMSSFELIIGSRRFAAVYRFLDETEAARVLRGYQRRNWLIAPVIRLMLSRFVGWRYDGSEQQSRRLAAQLPVIGFHPQP